MKACILAMLAPSATLLTLWQDEEALKKSEKDVFARAIKKVQASLERVPRIEN
jgi:hypothetical protein